MKNYCPLCNSLRCEGECQEKPKKPKLKKKNPKKKLKWTPNGIQYDDK